MAFFSSIILLLGLTNGESLEHWYDHFEYNSFIDSDAMFQVFWTPREESCTVEFGIAVETDSYAAFGISESGGMVGADIIMGWITEDGEVIMQNRYALGYFTPSLFDDQSSGFTLIDGWKEDINGTTTTFLHFEKETFPDFDENAVNIKIGTTRVIYAFGSEPMDANSIPLQHCSDCRGPQSMNLLQGESTSISLPDDAESLDILVDEHTIPAEDTTYYCSLHELPRFDDTQHVVRIDPVIEPLENEGTVHHILLYYCPQQFINETDIGESWICDEMAENMAPYQCRGTVVFAGWAIGGSNFYFPDNVGMEMSGTGDDAVQYVLMEIHYDNPLERDDIVDRSGLRLYYTPTLREYSASVMLMSMGVSAFGQFVPPGIEQLTNLGYCTSGCTESGIPEEGVHGFANMLHMHTLGRAQVLRHIRDGVELRPIDLNEAYDFNYQQYIKFDEEILILPGDEFIIECTLDSSGNEEMVYGGEKTSEEMCMTFLMVYPKDLYYFYYQAALYGFYRNFTESGGGMELDGFYDVTIPGAEQFYHDFVTGNITGNFDGIPELPLSDPQRRIQSCFDMNLNPLDGSDEEVEILKPSVHYEEYDMNDFYVCANAASSSSSGFAWDEWYVIVGGAVIIAILLVSVLCVVRECKKEKVDLGDYLTAENEYGSATGVAAELTNGK